jgi:hypothetical protein
VQVVAEYTYGARKAVTAEVQTSNALEPDRPQLDRPAACVIAQQYSFATFVSLRFYSVKEKFGAG